MRTARILVSLLATFAPALALAGDPVQITVYKSPTCGCCGAWVSHLQRNGFEVITYDVSDVGPVKQSSGLPPELASCHTAFVDEYLIEGHVPASDVARLLEDKPAIRGLAVPRMPIGSPGMEGPNPERYEVLSFDASGKTEVFATHGP